MTDIANLVMKADASEIKTGAAELAKLEKASAAVEKQSLATAVATGQLLGDAIKATARAMYEMTVSLINLGDHMNDLHLKTGVAVADLATYDHLAKQSGTTVEGVAQSFKFLGRYMTDHGDRLRELGVTSKDSNVAMGQFADVISSIQDPALRSTLALTVLGRSGNEMIPMLIGGSAAFKQASDESKSYREALEKVAPQSDKFNDTLQVLKTNSQAASLELVGKLLPTLQDIASKAVIAQKDFGALTAAFISAGTAGEAIVVLGANIAYVFKQTGIEIGGMAAQLAAIAHGDFKGAADIGKMMKADAEAARKEIDAYTEGVLKLGAAKIEAAGGTTGKPAVDNADAKAKELLHAAERKRLQEEENKRINAQAAEEVKMREADAAANQRAIEHEFNTGKQRIENIDKQITAQKRHNEEIGKTPEQIAKIKAKYDELTITTLEAEAAQLLYYGSDISDAGKIKLEQLDAEIAKRKELAKVEEAAAPLEAAKKTAAEMEAANKKAAAEAEQHWKNFSRNVQSHLGDSLYNALNGNFKNIGDSFKQMIFRMMADAAAADLTKAILGSPSSGGGSGGMGFIKDIGSKIGGMLSFAGGGSTGSGARSGGVDGMGGFPAILHPNETVIDHSAGQSGAGNSVTVVQNINIDSRSDYSTIVGAMMRAKDMAKAEIMQSLQRGGDFAGAVGRA